MAPDAQEIRRAVDEVLSRRAYVDDEPSWLAERLEQVRLWFVARLIDLVTAASGATIGWSILAVAVVIALFVAWRLTRGTRWERSADAAVVDLERRSAADWGTLSRAAEQRGDLREAVRTAYRAVLAAYVEAGAVDEVPGRTVGEYRSDVGAADPLRRADFDRASDTVEAVLYADRPASADDLAVVRSAGPSRSRVRA